MSKIEVRRPVSDWAKLPIDWIREGGLANFADESYSQKSMWMKEDKSARNVCISSLKLYLALCCRADFITGNASVTYEELIRLTGLSRPTVAKALKRLEAEELIQRKAQALRKGSSILICGWVESKSWAKIPKRWLYDGSFGAKILMLTDFNFSRASLSALKIYIALLAYRDSNRGGIAMLSYDRLALVTGVKRHHIADAITRLYDLRMISFRQVDFSEDSDFSRTNRYLVRGLGVHWPRQTNLRCLKVRLIKVVPVLLVLQQLIVLSPPRQRARNGEGQPSFKLIPFERRMEEMSLLSALVPIRCTGVLLW